MHHDTFTTIQIVALVATAPLLGGAVMLMLARRPVTGLALWYALIFMALAFSAVNLRDAYLLDTVAIGDSPVGMLVRLGALGAALLVFLLTWKDVDHGSRD